MEKDQVTFAVTAVRLPAPVGTPILLLSLGSDADGQQLHLSLGYPERLLRQKTLTAPNGPLSPYRANLWAAELAAFFQTWIFRYVGIQGEWEWPGGV